MEANNTVKINGTEYKVKNTIRALFVFEQIAGKPFSIDSSLDNFVFLYSVILACNRDKALSWEAFLDAVDEDKSIIDRMNEILKEADELDRLLADETAGVDGEKKN